MMTISVIIGSNAQGPVLRRPAQWILQELGKRDAIETRLLDSASSRCLSSTSPCASYAGPTAYENDVVKKWTATSRRRMVLCSSAGIQLRPLGGAEKRHRLGLPEWNRKAAAFVSYGSAMGARAISSFARRQSRFK